MSFGGLLASAIGGGARSGAAMADKIATEDRKQKGLFQIGNLENDRKVDAATVAYERQQNSATTAYDRQGERDRINHARNLQLARIKTRTKTAKSPWVFKEGTDENGDKVAGRYNATTNVWEKANAVNKPDISSLISKINVRGDKTKTQAEKKEQNRVDQQSKDDNKEAKVIERVNQLAPAALFTNEEVSEVERITRKQEGGEYLAPEEAQILLRYEELANRRLSSLQQEQEEKERESKTGRLPGHNAGTSGFLNRALKANGNQ